MKKYTNDEEVPNEHLNHFLKSFALVIMDTIRNMNAERLTALLAFIDSLCHYHYYRKLLIFNILYIMRTDLILISCMYLIVMGFS